MWRRWPKEEPTPGKWNVRKRGDLNEGDDDGAELDPPPKYTTVDGEPGPGKRCKPSKRQRAQRRLEREQLVEGKGKGRDWQEMGRARYGSPPARHVHEPAAATSLTAATSNVHGCPPAQQHDAARSSSSARLPVSTPPARHVHETLPATATSMTTAMPDVPGSPPVGTGSSPAGGACLATPDVQSHAAATENIALQGLVHICHTMLGHIIGQRSPLLQHMPWDYQPQHPYMPAVAHLPAHMSQSQIPHGAGAAFPSSQHPPAWMAPGGNNPGNVPLPAGPLQYGMSPPWPPSWSGQGQVGHEAPVDISEGHSLMGQVADGWPSGSACTPGPRTMASEPALNAVCVELQEVDACVGGVGVPPGGATGPVVGIFDPALEYLRKRLLARAAAATEWQAPPP